MASETITEHCREEGKRLRGVFVQSMVNVRCFLEVAEVIKASPLSQQHPTIAEYFETESARIAAIECARPVYVMFRMRYATFLVVAAEIIRGQSSESLMRAIGGAIAATAEGIASIAPHTAEVLSLIGTDILEHYNDGQ